MPTGQTSRARKNQSTSHQKNLMKMAVAFSLLHERVHSFSWLWLFAICCCPEEGRLNLNLTTGKVLYIAGALCLILVQCLFFFCLAKNSFCTISLHSTSELKLRKHCAVEVRKLRNKPHTIKDIKTKTFIEPMTAPGPARPILVCTM